MEQTTGRSPPQINQNTMHQLLRIIHSMRDDHRKALDRIVKLENEVALLKLSVLSVANKSDASPQGPPLSTFSSPGSIWQPSHVDARSGEPLRWTGAETSMESTRVQPHKPAAQAASSTVAGRSTRSWPLAQLPPLRSSTNPAATKASTESSASSAVKDTGSRRIVRRVMYNGKLLGTEQVFVDGVSGKEQVITREGNVGVRLDDASSAVQPDAGGARTVTAPKPTADITMPKPSTSPLMTSTAPAPTAPTVTGTSVVSSKSTSTTNATTSTTTTASADSALPINTAPSTLPEAFSSVVGGFSTPDGMDFNTMELVVTRDGTKLIQKSPTLQPTDTSAVVSTEGRTDQTDVPAASPEEAKASSKLADPEPSSTDDVLAPATNATLGTPSRGHVVGKSGNRKRKKRKKKRKAVARKTGNGDAPTASVEEMEPVQPVETQPASDNVDDGEGGPGSAVPSSPTAAGGDGAEGELASTSAEQPEGAGGPGEADTPSERTDGETDTGTSSPPQPGVSATASGSGSNRSWAALFTVPSGSPGAVQPPRNPSIGSRGDASVLSPGVPTASKLQAPSPSEDPALNLSPGRVTSPVEPSPVTPSSSTTTTTTTTTTSTSAVSMAKKSSLSWADMSESSDSESQVAVIRSPQLGAVSEQKREASVWGKNSSQGADTPSVSESDEQATSDFKRTTIARSNSGEWSAVPAKSSRHKSRNQRRRQREQGSSGPRGTGRLHMPYVKAMDEAIAKKQTLSVSFAYGNFRDVRPLLWADKPRLVKVLIVEKDEQCHFPLSRITGIAGVVGFPGAREPGVKPPRETLRI